MASEKATAVTGTDVGDGLRRRQVPGQAGPAVPTLVEVDDKKLAKKVHLMAH
jgi:hypothetical protein